MSKEPFDIKTTNPFNRPRPKANGTKTGVSKRTLTRSGISNRPNIISFTRVSKRAFDDADETTSAYYDAISLDYITRVFEPYVLKNERRVRECRNPNARQFHVHTESTYRSIFTRNVRHKFTLSSVTGSQAAVPSDVFQICFVAALAVSKWSVASVAVCRQLKRIIRAVSKPEISNSKRKRTYDRRLSNRVRRQLRASCFRCSALKL